MLDTKILFIIFIARTIFSLPFSSFWHVIDSQKYWKYQKIFSLFLRYRHLHNPSLKLDLQVPRLDDLPACQEALHNKFVIDYNKIMKSDGFRCRLCDNVCSKEVSLLCLVKFVALVLLWCWKKNNIKRARPQRMYSI